MNAGAYIDFAAKIAVTYSDAASCRSAISRAYYGAFHLARALLDRIELRPPRNANVHVFIQQRLANCGYPRAVEAGHLLTGLYADRLNADYHLDKKQVEAVGYARTAVVTARRVQESLEACDTDEGRERIRAGIAEYERRISGR